MLDDVGDRFAGDRVERRLAQRVEPSLVAEHDHMAARRTADAELPNPLLDRARHAQLLQAARLQVVDVASQFDHARRQLVLEVTKPVEHGSRVGKDAALARLQSERDAEQRLREPVVHLVRDTLPLPGQQRVACPLRQSGVLDRHRRECAEYRKEARLGRGERPLVGVDRRQQADRPIGELDRRAEHRGVGPAVAHERTVAAVEHVARYELELRRPPRLVVAIPAAADAEPFAIHGQRVGVSHEREHRLVRARDALGTVDDGVEDVVHGTAGGHGSCDLMQGFDEVVVQDVPASLTEHDAPLMAPWSTRRFYPSGVRATPNTEGAAGRRRLRL